MRHWRRVRRQADRDGKTVNITPSTTTSPLSADMSFPRFALTLALLFGAFGLSQAGQLSTHSNYAAVPGSTNEVDILIDSAAGVASIALKVNYDPSLLNLLAVTNKPGSLGANFSIESKGGDGTATIVLTRQDALSTGAGIVATLVFRVNPGATAGMSCELPVVRHELGGQYGESIEGRAAGTDSSGKLWVVSSMTADSDGDGIPDWWAIANFGGPTNVVADADDDNDGQSNLAEFRTGTNPHDSTDSFRIRDMAATSPAAGHGLVIRWVSAPTVAYAIDRSTNLMSGFEGLASNIVTGGIEGSYTDETATVESSLFYRVLVK